MGACVLGSFCSISMAATKGQSPREIHHFVFKCVFMKLWLEITKEIV